MPDQTWDESERRRRSIRAAAYQRDRRERVVSEGGPGGPVKCPQCGGSGKRYLTLPGKVTDADLFVRDRCSLCRGVGQVRYVPVGNPAVVGGVYTIASNGQVLVAVPLGDEDRTDEFPPLDIPKYEVGENGAG